MNDRSALIHGSWRTRFSVFGYASVLHGCDEENDERLRKELQTFADEHNCTLTRETMMWSIHRKTHKSVQDSKLETAWEKSDKRWSINE